ncbi:MAG: hypothetical protein KGI50_00545 [Patescibacteria group bacterium]|nr:hypothetical protein [Patescibacteria group bacterium]MDE2438155.1 hypothetical protein [Patescibacteria group bacterium]
MNTLKPNDFDHPISYMIQKKIRSASRHEVATSLCAWLESWLDVGYIDDEYIEYAGMHVAAEEKTGIDDDVFSWFKKDPTEKRLFIAVSFCMGYWGAMPVSEPCMEIILTVFATTRRDTMLYRVLLGALCRKITNLSGTLRTRAEEVLLAEEPFIMERITIEQEDVLHEQGAYACLGVLFKMLRANKVIS